MREAEGPVRMPSVAKLSPYLVWLAWIVWLPFLVLDAVSLARGVAAASLIIAAIALVGLFAVTYAWATLRNVRDLFYFDNIDYQRRSLGNWPIAAFMSFLSAVIAVLGKGDGLDIMGGFIFTGAYVGGAFSWRRAAIANLVLLGVCLALRAVFHISNPLNLFLIPVVSFMVMLVRQSITAGKDLRAAQEEISRLAVGAERLRIARDLHDLLGHALSLIALKSELARRLVYVSPERADREMGDVEASARSMLQEVREALSQYRRPELARELGSVRDILEAAGIAFASEVDEGALTGLPPAQEEALAWTLREGVTNLVRHGGARSRSLRIRRGKGRVFVELVDDGRQREIQEGAGRGPSQGAGLAGLKERAELLGGELQAGFMEGGGFRLSVSLPLQEGTG